MDFIFTYWKILLGVVLLVTLLGITYKIYDSGYEEAQKVQVQKQVKHNQKVEKIFRKVDNEAPINADRNARSEWLRKHTGK